MSYAVKNGVVGGIIAYLILIIFTAVFKNINFPAGIISLLIIIALMFYSAKSFSSASVFQRHVREPFLTFLIASIIYHFMRLVYPGDVDVSHTYFLAFLVSLIIGFLLSALITFMVRKLD